MRFSDDLDIVVSEIEVENIKNWLSNNNFILEISATLNTQNYGGKFFRFRKEEVTIDLLAGSVRDRDARVDIREEWISKNYFSRRIVGYNSNTNLEIPIARPEAMWALKLQSGRGRDLADLYGIYELPFSSNEVIQLFQNLKCDTLDKKLLKTKAACNDPELYPKIRSRLEFKDSESHSNKWSKFVQDVNQIVDQSIT